VRIVRQLCDYQAVALQPIVWMALGAARGEARDFDAPTSPCSGQWNNVSTTHRAAP